MSKDAIEKIQAEYTNVMELVTSSKQTERKKRKNCKLCNSQFMNEAEAIYEAKHNAADVIRYLHTKEEYISPKAVRDHLNNHWYAAKTAVDVQEFAENLMPYFAVKKDDVSTIRMCTAILTKEIIEISAISSSMSIVERRNSAKTVIDLMKTLLACQEAEDKIKGEMRPIHVFIEKFEKVYQTEQDTASPDVKQSMAKVFNTLYNELGDYMVEVK